MKKRHRIALFAIKQNIQNVAQRRNQNRGNRAIIETKKKMHLDDA